MAIVSFIALVKCDSTNNHIPVILIELLAVAYLAKGRGTYCRKETLVRDIQSGVANEGERFQLFFLHFLYKGKTVSSEHV